MVQLILLFSRAFGNETIAVPPTKVGESSGPSTLRRIGNSLDHFEDSKAQIDAFDATERVQHFRYVAGA